MSLRRWAYLREFQRSMIRRRSFSDPSESEQNRELKIDDGSDVDHFTTRMALKLLLKNFTFQLATMCYGYEVWPVRKCLVFHELRYVHRRHSWRPVEDGESEKSRPCVTIDLYVIGQTSRRVRRKALNWRLNCKGLFFPIRPRPRKLNDALRTLIIHFSCSF